MSINLLDSTRLSLCLTFLSIASIYDVRFREVPNILWVIFAPLGLALSLVSLVFGSLDWMLILMWVAVFTIVLGLSFALFYLGLFGGADAKALICLAISAPIKLDTGIIKPILEYGFLPPVVISTFNNAVLFASSLAIAIALRNFIDLFRSHGKIFSGLEEESFLKKVLAFITGYRIDAERIRSKKHHYIIMEEFNFGENGSLKRRLRLLQLPDDTSEEYIKEVQERIHGKIWVTPGLPFLLFIEAGFVTTIFLGDILFWLISNLF